MPDIKPTVESINSIQSKYKKLRQLSKAPTFALTYQGTWRTLVQNCGFDEETAKKIEAQYHELYRESDAWVQAKLAEAAERGYAELAFGLRLHTPLMAQTVWNSSYKPYEAKKEAKTVGNALTQSYGLLNSHAANLFMARVWDSEWRLKVFPIAQIHDAQYYLISNTLGCVEWVNNNLIECMTWNGLEEIQHDQVKLEAELEIYWPTWADSIPIPNGATRSQIKEIVTKVKKEQQK
jgi:DNA polymerase-1